MINVNNLIQNLREETEMFFMGVIGTVVFIAVMYVSIVFFAKQSYINIASYDGYQYIDQSSVAYGADTMTDNSPIKTEFSR